MKMPSVLSSPYVTIGALAGLVLLAGGISISEYMEEKKRDLCNTEFALLNERWRCEDDAAPKNQEYNQLATTLLWRTEEWKQTGEVTNVSVQFRDLEYGSTISINGLEQFAPASLLKVPVMMALYKYAETDPSILDKEVEMIHYDPSGQNVFDVDKTLMLGQKYPVHEVMRRMIVYSDNFSKELLREMLETLSPGIIDQTFIDLGVSTSNPDGSQYLTVKSYASLFRTLFNASYINRAASQEALALLTDVEFRQGIEAGIPQDIVVAHKFGYLDLPSGEEQLHDCGIIYYADSPYLLCVMARGYDVDQISAVIAKISKLVYDEVALKKYGE